MSDITFCAVLDYMKRNLFSRHGLGKNACFPRGVLWRVVQHLRNGRLLLYSKTPKQQLAWSKCLFLLSHKSVVYTQMHFVVLKMAVMLEQSSTQLLQVCSWSNTSALNLSMQTAISIKAELSEYFRHGIIASCYLWLSKY